MIVMKKYVSAVSQKMHCWQNWRFSIWRKLNLCSFPHVWQRCENLNKKITSKAYGGIFILVQKLFMLKKSTKWYKNRWITSWGCGKSFKSFCNLYCWIMLFTPNFFHSDDALEELKPLNMHMMLTKKRDKMR